VAKRNTKANRHTSKFRAKPASNNTRAVNRRNPLQQRHTAITKKCVAVKLAPLADSRKNFSTENRRFPTDRILRLHQPNATPSIAETRSTSATQKSQLSKPALKAKSRQTAVNGPHF